MSLIAMMVISLMLLCLMPCMMMLARNFGVPISYSVLSNCWYASSQTVAGIGWLHVMIWSLVSSDSLQKKHRGDGINFQE